MSRAKAAAPHSDDLAVDRFAVAMKAKLAAARAKGRGGWDDPDQCPVERLADMLREHVGKTNAGSFEDIANFAMMLHQRGAAPSVLAPESKGEVRDPTDEELQQFMVEEQFLLFCDADECIQIARAVIARYGRQS